MGGMLRAPWSVAMTTDQTVPITTTNSIAVSVWPNQTKARGTQHTLGRVCSPSARVPTVSSSVRDALVSRPSGRPMASPMP